MLVASCVLPGMAAADECGSPDTATVLTPDVSGVSGARAIWLDRSRIRWPGSHHGRVVLVESRSGQLRARKGERLSGADASWPLASEDRPLPRDVRDRYSFVAAGLDVRVPPAAIRDLSAQRVLVALDPQGRVEEATYLQSPGLLDDLYAGDAEGPAAPGAEVTATRTTYRVWAPTARKVTICRYTQAEGGTAETSVMGRAAGSGSWVLRVPRREQGRAYAYLVEVFVPGAGWVRNRVTDPWSSALTADSRRSVAMDLSDPSLQPTGWREARRPAPPRALPDMAIYELHVRDFSINDATVPVAHRGKYLAFTDATSAGMQHLRELAQAGLSDIHLLPVFDIASIPERGCITPVIPDAPADSDRQQAAVMAVAARDCFNWGYDPLHYGVPEGSYSSDAGDPATRIREFRAMVVALHDAGLRVGMDVVYNHTPAAGQVAQSVLDRIVPGYYQRLDADGKVETSTCCSNTATEHAMMARLLRDTLVRWVRDYHVDSFRFDLMGHQPLAVMEDAQRAVVRAAGRGIPFIGEGWNFGEIADNKRFVQAVQLELAGSGIGSFNDRMRDAARGGGCCDSGADLLAKQGWLTGLATTTNGRGGDASKDALAKSADLIRAGLAGSLRDFRMKDADGVERTLAQLQYKDQPAGYAAIPGEAVNYVENHDNPTLFDVGVMKLPVATTSEERARMQVLGMALVALAQGTPYFHAGIDLMRSKSLDRNSFDSGDWFNRIDWTGDTNHFGSGLPPKPDNGKDWPLLAPLLRDVVPPMPQDIAYAKASFRELLRIRAGSALFHLHDAREVERRLQFPATGPGSDPAVIVGRLDGRGLPGAGFDGVLYLLNAAPSERNVTLPQERGQGWRLHPVQARGVDARIRTRAKFDPSSATFHVPGRSAVVFVIPHKVSPQ